MAKTINPNRVTYPMTDKKGVLKHVSANQLPRVVVYLGRDEEWHWKKFAPNGHNVSNGGQGYSRRSDAKGMAVDQVRPFLLVLEDRQGNVEQRRVVDHLNPIN